MRMVLVLSSTRIRSSSCSTPFKPASPSSYHTARPTARCYIRQRLVAMGRIVVLVWTDRVGQHLQHHAVHRVSRRADPRPRLQGVQEGRRPGSAARRQVAKGCPTDRGIVGIPIAGYKAVAVYILVYIVVHDCYNTDGQHRYAPNVREAT